MLTSPNLVQLNTPKNMENMDSKTDKIRNPLNNKPIDCHKNINSIDALPRSHALNSKLKVLPPPPRAFRDPPGKMDSKTDKIRNPLNNKPIIEDKRIQNLEKISIEPGHSVPMRRKAKEINNIMDHSTSSLSR